jgi:hypothetical protein
VFPVTSSPHLCMLDSQARLTPHPHTGMASRSTTASAYCFSLNTASDLTKPAQMQSLLVTVFSYPVQFRSSPA